MSQIHLIAPSGYCINQDAAQRGVQRLLESGHQVENQTIIPRRQQRFAGTEAQRLNDINSLVNLKGENRIVLAVRGGYGASRLLESIDWQGLAERQQQDPLLICGHSDFTVIQLGLLALHNVITFSGPMLAGNFGAPELEAFTVEHFWRALRNPTYSVEWQGNGPHWECEGQLWGGNLAMLVSLIGTPWMPNIENGILVLEDINEHPFRVERMLLQLYHTGILERQSAIVLGSFSGAAPNDYDAGYSLETMVEFIRSRLDIPVIAGLDFGHEQRTVTLALAAHASLIHNDSGSRLTISGHPVIKA
ncbi:muramoyltetrapeptide carboxypeptidase [Enterobacter roggenkampii]|uniref:Muramoyltetrapeptide carboxypeptidase n=1 Tax=Enterobacter roggenkampii TaxID=1812935 RepID=A0ABD4R1Y8_9ENTR|nr:muramoyltetrapeptide carboxypeptidase [Enterobacter roggenkampii]MBU3753985.1 muramoyltetrapeptide carboxypeptidase [Enterobacter roggenkampii]MBU3761639.1 muramoyltetrapeptide carboxypeptidase [Enterobacter roggenkampii]MBU3765693.1 muramoyltetrapeptide carboxypeptidase [Enterobacter roggenkampii]MBU3770669.1 muramoyltetrapeptide carboxypeptidase [Enterobacter roggenkampii]MBU3775077.1 muramoyltetrapeptide carboxypeptidase [Enterobacter roggenkampii]